MNKTLKFLSVPLAVTVIFGTLLSSYNASADDTVDEINITVPVSCTMSGTGQDSHNATINNGQSNSTIGETTMKVFCNDNNGFAIYAIGYTDNTDGKNVLTSSTLGDNYDIVTGTATGPVGNTDISQWAMKLSTITDPAPNYPIIIAGSSADTDREQGDPDYSTFQEVPDDYTLVVKRTSGTDINPAGQSTAEGATLKSTYQAYISKTQPAGTYTGQVKYTLIHPATATAPQKPLGLCQSSDTCMQQQTPASMARKLPNVGDTTTLYDARDNQTYTVVKLADGNYWMTENLNIAGGTALSSEDTDFDSSFVAPEDWTTVNDKIVLPDSSTSGTGFNIIYNSGNKDNCGYSGQNTPCYSYYSWDVTTLGSGRESRDDADAPYSICPKSWRLPKTRRFENWQTESEYYVLAHQYGLDSTTEYNEYDDDFYNQAGPGTIPNFLLAGHYTIYSYSPDSAVPFEDGGSRGSYWTSTPFTSAGESAWSMSFTANRISSRMDMPQKGYGLSVRCLLKTN